MVINVRVMQEIISEGLKADRKRRDNAVRMLMSEGLPWEEAYRQVNFPHKTKEAWAKMCREYDEAFGVAK